jgi:YD repeat-containing protein
MQIKAARQSDPAPSMTTSMKAIAAIVLMLMLTEVLAQSRTFYGADGRVTGRTSTSGNQTTIYGSDGRRVGTVTTTKPQGR